MESHDTHIRNKPCIPVKPAYEIIKRIIDVLGASFGLIVFAPAFLVIALAVRRSSEGPILYRAERSGRNDSTFTIFKFRSMYIESDKGSATTSRNDPRITPVGKFIRKSKLDEIPQFINVLIGNMSLVGPRPELPRYTDMYEGDEKIILLVKPGITDYSSIEFSNMNELIDEGDPEKVYRETLMKRKNELRVKYVRERGVIVDLKVIIFTVLRVFGIK